MLLKELQKLGLSVDDLPKLKIDLSQVPEEDDEANYLRNYAFKSTENDLPVMSSFDEVYPDFAVLERETSKYSYTDKTMLTWLEDDSEFKKNGHDLYKAIIEKDELTLRWFKYKYRNIHFFSPVDFSIYGKECKYVILKRLAQISITFLWMALELDGVTYPLLTWGNENTFSYCFDNIDRGSNVVVSLKGSMKKNYNKEIARKAITRFVSSKTPKALLIISDSAEEKNEFILSPAREQGIPIYYLDNTLASVNLRRRKNG